MEASLIVLGFISLCGLIIAGILAYDVLIDPPKPPSIVEKVVQNTETHLAMLGLSQQIERDIYGGNADYKPSPIHEEIDCPYCNPDNSHEIPVLAKPKKKAKKKSKKKAKKTK